MRDVAGDPLGAGVRYAGSVSGLDEDCPHPGVSSAPDVACFVANQERPAQIDVMIALRLEIMLGPGLRRIEFDEGKSGEW